MSVQDWEYIQTREPRKAGQRNPRPARHPAGSSSLTARQGPALLPCLPLVAPLQPED